MQIFGYFSFVCMTYYKGLFDPLSPPLPGWTQIIAICSLRTAVILVFYSLPDTCDTPFPLPRRQTPFTSFHPPHLPPFSLFVVSSMIFQVCLSVPPYFFWPNPLFFPRHNPIFNISVGERGFLGEFFSPFKFRFRFASGPASSTVYFS